MKRLSKFSGIVASLFLILFFVALGASPVMAADVCDKKPELPKCSDPDPDPGEEPTLAIPAFAYYCKSNPNVGGICLANDDGSVPIKIFSTEKFHGDRFEISAVQVGVSGSVLVEDYGALSQIDYTVTSEGLLDTVSSPISLTTGVGDVDWNPVGSDFSFHDHYGVYLGSRAALASDERGAPIVQSPISPWIGEITEVLRSLSWSYDGTSIYFIKGYIVSDGPWWDEVHKADVHDYLSNGTQTTTTCLLASREAPYSDRDYCAVIDENLSRLSKVSDHQNGLMVAATGLDLAGDPEEEINFIYILDDFGVSEIIPTPGFLGFDWTVDGQIISQTDDDEIIVYDHVSGEVRMLLNKNATSPDWSN